MSRILDAIVGILAAIFVALVVCLYVRYAFDKITALRGICDALQQLVTIAGRMH